MGWFSKEKTEHQSAERHAEFAYLANDFYYFDSSCQTLRPESVIRSMEEYYHTYNACGGRVKYPWGKKVDDRITMVRKDILAFFEKKESDYAVAFTQNTTYGVNLIMSQLPWANFETIVTTDIEHNSIFLPSQTYTSKHKKQRLVLERKEDGTIDASELPSSPSVLLMNVTSNIDGRAPSLENVIESTKKIQEQKGIVLYDCAQAGAHHPTLIRKSTADAYFLSGHKMYGPSIGIIIIKKTLLASMEWSFIGGGSVLDVDLDTFTLLPMDEDPVAPLEPGLQLWAEIIGMGEAIRFLKNLERTSPLEVQEKVLAELLWEKLKDIPSLHFLTPQASPVLSFYSDKMDAHTLAMILGEQGIMSRSGYFCCHYFLKHKKQLPPLLRISLGAHTTTTDIEHLASTLSSILSAL